MSNKAVKKQLSNEVIHLTIFVDKLSKSPIKGKENILEGIQLGLLVAGILDETGKNPELRKEILNTVYKQISEYKETAA